MTEKPIQITAKVRIRSAYGNDFVYPADEKSELLARIAGTKTLTPDTIEYAKQLGIAFEVIAENKAL